MLGIFIGLVFLLPQAPISGESEALGLVALEGQGNQNEKRVKMTARRFHFRPSKIQVSTGTRLTIELSSRDVEHGFHFEAAGVNLVIPARGKGNREVIFEATAPGTYRFYCSKVCGAGHAEMRGSVVVKNSD